MYKYRIGKIVIISVIAILITVSVSNALRITPSSLQLINIDEDGLPFENLDGSTYYWDDDFKDQSKIDPLLSHNYIIDIAGSGIITMDATLEAWKEPDWMCVKPIDISNQGSQPISNYVLDITVFYDSDMQSDFDDIRFTDEDGIYLDYYVNEKTNGVSAQMLVQIPMLPAGETIKIYMFYGNPVASSASSDDIFTLEEVTADEDIRVSYVSAEGAWDPNVAYGSNKFFVAWEEGIGPQTSRILPRQIHGRTYNVDGSNPSPLPENGDIIISLNQNNYHAENPSIVYGGGKFFVAWEENSIFLPNAVDIKGALVYSSGSISKRFTICDAYSGQFDPCVAYDSSSNRFFVVWEDARSGSTNYDIYGKIFSSSGTQIGSEIHVASESNTQAEPWVCSDDNGHFLVVYEHGTNPETGPFSLYARRFDSSGSEIGSRITIAIGSSSTDYIFPSAVYCPETERYLVAWNDGDISQNPNSRYAYDGNIWGKILDDTGSTIVDNFIIQSGYDYIRPDVVTYFETMFFVAYDDTDRIWGKFVSSDGTMVSERQGLSDDITQEVDWCNLAVGGGNIVSVWEDERVLDSLVDSYGSIWHISYSTGSSDITYVFGDEDELILESVVTSYVIAPEEFREWHDFFSIYLPSIHGSIKFDIMDETGTIILFEDVSSGNDISAVTNPIIRLRATFTRTTPEDAPVLDSWNVSGLVGTDIEPPWTFIFLNPENPNENGWYNEPVILTFEAHDNVSISENITTYYKINDEDVEIYNESNKPMITSERSDNMVEFWSVDEVENEELPHNFVYDIKIDATVPFVKILEPKPGLIDSGEIDVIGTISESSSGSGIESVELYFNGGEVPEDQVTIIDDLFYWNFTAKDGQHYDLHAKSYDYAGNKGADRVEVNCDESYGMIEIGYLYLFDNKVHIGLLENLELAVVVDDENLVLRLKEYHENATSARFIAHKINSGNEYFVWDYNLSDGCIVDFYVPFGLYEFKAYTYDDNDILLGEHIVISKVLVILV